MNLKNLIVFTGLFLSCGTVAMAAPAPAPVPASPVQLVGEVKLDKIVVENGQEKHVFSEPKVVVPGDHLVFSTAYRNTGSAPVNNFIVTNPLPAGVALTPDVDGALNVSVDGGKVWGQLATLSVSDGKGGKRAAQAGDVTHIRWTLPLLQPGASGTLTYHAIVR